jgi:endonuclease/exonuclease/phosphatase family metal-dependent hydrolase
VILRIVVIAFFLTGCATAPPAGGAAEPTPATLRVASYNIRHGRGMDDRVDLARIADVLRRLGADVIALQEVDEGVERSGGEDQAARLGRMLGMSHAFGSFMDYQGGRYGMAILSRFPLRSVDPVRLTDGNEPRVALAVEIAGPGSTTITVVNVHFDWVADDGFRFTQAGEVGRYLDAISNPWILIGDFNDQPGSRTLDLFHARAIEAAKPADRRFTFPATAPAREIDYVFVSPADAWTIRKVEVVNETIASDHRPVLVDLEVRNVVPARSGR